MVLHVVWTELIFGVFISAQCGWLSSRTCFWAVTMGIAFFSLSLAISWVPSSNQDPHRLIFSSSQPWLPPLSLLLWLLFHPPLALSAALSPLLLLPFLPYYFHVTSWAYGGEKDHWWEPFYSFSFIYTRGCAEGCVLARECVVRILALIMAGFMQMKDCFWRYKP